MGNPDVRVQGRLIQAGIATVDAVSGQMTVGLPLGPTLPGRIPLGISWQYDTASLMPGSRLRGKAVLTPFVWPLGAEAWGQAKVYATLRGQDSVFYFTSAAPTEVDNWLAARNVPLPSWLSSYSGLLKKTRVYASESGISYFVLDRWYRIKTMPDGASAQINVGFRMTVVAGDIAMSTDFEEPDLSQPAMPMTTMPRTITRLGNRWGDWVMVTEEGRPLARLRIETSLGHFVELASDSLPADCTSGAAVYRITNNMGIAAVTVNANVDTSLWCLDVNGNPKGKLPWPTATHVAITKVSDDLRGQTHEIEYLNQITRITLANGLTHRFTWTGTEGAGNQAAEGFAAEDTGGLKKGDWKGWEPVTYLTATHRIGERRPGIRFISAESSFTYEQGHAIEFLRTLPIPAGYDPTAGTINWTATSHLTEIRRYPNPEGTGPYRFTRLQHAQPLGVYGRPDQDAASQMQMLLFAMGAVVKEETGIFEGGVETVRSRTIYDGWSLKSFTNGAGVIGSGLPLIPEATRTILERPLGDGPTMVRERLDWDGRSYARTTAATLKPGAAVAHSDGTGRPQAAQWRGTGLPEGCTLTGNIHRTATTARTWDSTLAQLRLDTSGETVAGGDYFSLRGAASADLGTRTYRYDGLGRTEKVTGVTGAFTSILEQTFLASRPEVESTTRSITGPEGAAALSGRVGEVFGYSGLWRSSVQAKPDPRSTGEGRDDLGRLRTLIAPDGVRTTFHYDALGRMYKSVRETNGALAAVETWTEWDPAGRWMREYSQGHDGTDLINETLYDAFGRPVRTVTAVGTAAERTVDRRFDGWGQKTGESLPTKPGMAMQYATWEFELDGFLKTAKNSKGTVMATYTRPSWGTLDGVEGFLSTVQGFRGQSRQILTDLLGQTVRQTDALGQISSMKYDAFGRLVEARRGTQVRRYSYNEMGWLMSQTQPEEGTTTYSQHTVGGSPLLVQKGALTTTQVLYPSGDRREGLTKTLSATGVGASVTRELDYDGNRRLLSVVEAQPGGTLTETYGYDDLGRLNRRTTGDGVHSFIVEQVLDRFGKVLELKYPTGGGKLARSAVPTYDRLHRVKTLSHAGALLLSDVTYDQDFSGMEGETARYANGATSTWKRDDHHELRQVTHKVAGTTFEDAAVTWTQDGLMESRGLDAFEYDELGRLKTSTVSGLNGEKVRQVFGYDGYGNRTSVTATALAGVLPEEALSFSVSINSDNRLPAVTNSGATTGAVYDELGRLSRILAIPGRSDSLTEWEHDALGRVVRQAWSSSTWAESYLLDGAGLRFKRIRPDGIVQYTVYGFGREPLSVFELAAAVPEAHGGTKAARVFHQPAGNGALSRNLGSFTAGDAITVKVWFKAPAGVSGALFLSDRGVPGPGDTKAFASREGNGGWQELVLTAVAGRTEALWVHLYGDHFTATSAVASGQTSVLYDDLRVTSEQRGAVLTEGFEGGIAIAGDVWSTSAWTSCGQQVEVASGTTGGGLSWVSDAVYGLGQLIFEKRGTRGVFQQGDHLGTPSILTDDGGQVIGRQKALPFGERLAGQGEKSLRRFTNHEDQAAFPIYMQARMYLPTYGRFAEVDPAYDQAALDPESWNLYSYVTNNPVTRTDPDGMREVGREADPRSGWKKELDFVNAWGGVDDLNGGWGDHWMMKYVPADAVSTEVLMKDTYSDGKTVITYRERTAAEDLIKSQSSQTGERERSPGGADPVTQNKTGGFKDQDEAAAAALSIANPKSIKANREYAGLIYEEKDGSVHFTGPVRGTDQGVNAYKLAPAPKGTKVVGDYHTHGDYSVVGPKGQAIRTSDPKKDQFGSDRWNNDDRRQIIHDARGNPKYRAYLGTPSGRFLYFDPSTGAEGILR